MKAFHMSFHTGTITNVENVMNSLGHTIKSSMSLWPYYISNDMANRLWENNETFFKQFDILVFTDTTMLSRPILTNIEKFEGIVIVHITNRFDWGIWNIDDKDYFETLRKVSTNDRVRFCSDNRYDRYYASLFGIKFYTEDIVRLTPKLSPQIFSINNGKFFIYDKGSSYDNYKHHLVQNSIHTDVFSKEKGNPFKDQEHVSEYLAFLHLPYQANVQSLYENLGYNIVYVIPSKSFVKRLIKETDWYYWEEKHKSAEILQMSIDLSEWYQPENEGLFIYFDDWCEINDKVGSTDMLKKKEYIRDHMISNNDKYINVWKDLTSL